jgi:ATP-dependent Clp protease, protease subunit
MTLKKLPEPQAFQQPGGYSWDAPADALQHWSETPFAAEADNANTVSIYGVIGQDYMGDGFTAARMAGALRSIGKHDVTVNVNSPGGDMFEGLAIYNLLREHPAKVTIKVMGVAASAASIIAMAGDEVMMGTGSVMMIHNAWGMVVGNRHDFADAASVFQTFDASMAAIYAARTGIKEADIMKMLDGPSRASDGTYMTAADAIAKGFADSEFDGSATGGAAAKAALPEDILSRRRIEAALAKQGVGRKDRASLINSLSGQRDATGAAARDAGDLMAGLTQLLTSIRS